MRVRVYGGQEGGGALRERERKAGKMSENRGRTTTQYCTNKTRVVSDGGAEFVLCSCGGIGVGNNFCDLINKPRSRAPRSFYDITFSHFSSSYASASNAGPCF